VVSTEITPMWTRPALSTARAERQETWVADRHADAVRDDEVNRSCPLPPLPDALPRVLSRSDALARGFTRRGIDHRVATGSWRRVLPRTYHTADTLTDYDRLYAAVSFAGPGAALSGAAALFASNVKRITVPRRVLVLVPPENCASLSGGCRFDARPVLGSRCGGRGRGVSSRPGPPPIWR
jgi:hypothetical protein